MSAKSGGTYRIDDLEVPTPVAEWMDQPIGSLLNGLVSLNSYRVHRWTWPGGALEGCVIQDILTKFYAQQNGQAQLSALETDPFDASREDTGYHTVVYTDFIIKQVTPLRREFPIWADPEVLFEVYVG